MGDITFLLFPIYIFGIFYHEHTLLSLKSKVIKKKKNLLESSRISRIDKEHCFSYRTSVFLKCTQVIQPYKKKSGVYRYSLVKLWLVFVPNNSLFFLQFQCFLFVPTPDPKWLMINKPIFKCPKLYLFTDINLLILLTSNLLSGCFLHNTWKKELLSLLSGSLQSN